MRSILWIMAIPPLSEKTHYALEDFNIQKAEPIRPKIAYRFYTGAVSEGINAALPAAN